MEHRTPAPSHGAITLVPLDPARPDVEFLTASFLAGYRPSTRSAYEIDLRLWFRWLAANGVDALEVQRGHIELWMRSEEERGLKPATVNRRVCTVRLWYRHAFEEEHISTNPGARVRLPKVYDEAPSDYLDRWAMGDVIRTAMEYPRPEALALICLLGLAGLRVSEALGLNVGSVSDEDGYDVVKFRGKGDKPARVTLSPMTFRAVQALTVNRAPDEPLFLNAKGRRMTRRNAHDLSDRIIERSRVNGKKITPHSYRRSFISVALDQGVSITDVQMSARHESPSTTLRYDRRRNELARHATHVVSQTVAAAMRS